MTNELIRRKALENIPDLILLSPVGENWETYFGKWPCECCGSFLAGDRIDCQAITRGETNPDIKSVCADCLSLFQ